MDYQGLFIGLTTLDCIYLSDRHLQPNQKLVALDYLTAAGGPATNAAVAFGYFDNHPQLLTALGQHPITDLISNDLDDCGVEIVDLLPHKLDSPPLSSIIVNATTAERSIISLNALKSPGKRSHIPQDVLAEVDIILIDGHQIDVSLAILDLINDQQILVVLDGGSWKPGLEKILPKVDYAICSANFYPPECSNEQDVFSFLQAQGIERIAITKGQRPIQYCDRGQLNSLSVSQVKALDTLGAGDIFHGAFCHYILEEKFESALNYAAQIASKSCQYFGTRSWLNY